jgi:deoxyadenosine/deoxycytidine kinase
MENMKERTKKQHREEPDRKIEAEGRKKVWDWKLMKYYVHKEADVSSDDLKRYERLLNFEKTTGEKRR